MAPILEIRNLTKRYGKRTAVQGLNLTVEAGELFGFVGPNGAGKTSTIRIISTLLKPTSGDILLNGIPITKDLTSARRAIGYMPDFFGVYNNMFVWEYLDFFASCYKIPETARPELINNLLELVDLSHRREDRVDKLSRGMKQRLSLARALVHDPQILILDEPASGLDPRARVEIRELLVELAKMGKTIFFSTHILSDVEEICTRIGIIEAGNMVAVGELAALRKQAMPKRMIEITVLGQAAPAQTFLENLSSITQVQVKNDHINTDQTEFIFEFSGDESQASDLLTNLTQNGIRVLRYNPVQVDLETVFMRATKGMVT